MYALPQLHAVTEQWWRGLARHLRQAGVTGIPEYLSQRDDPASLWHDPTLLLSQTCGYPLTHALRGKLQPLATPVYRAAGCDGPRYASALVVPAHSRALHLADLRGGVCAVNSRDSHSGYNVLRRMLAPLADGKAFFRTVRTSGSHLASLAMVATGEVDICAVDCVTHALAARHTPHWLTGTRVLEWSPSAPGLPYVTGARTPSREAGRIRHALEAATADPALSQVRAALLIGGFELLPDSAYVEIAHMETESCELGYPEIT